MRLHPLVVALLLPASALAGADDVPAPPPAPILIDPPAPAPAPAPAAPAPAPARALPAAPVVPAAAPAHDPNLLDEVRLANQQVLYGTILDNASSDVTLDLNTGSGTLRIPMEQVDREHIVYGLTSRRARMDRDSLKELLDFAAWCQEHGYPLDALKALSRAVTMPDVPNSAVGELARLVDEGGHPDVSLPIYRRYQQAGGQDPALLARLTELEGILKDHEQKLADLGLPPDDPTGAGLAAADLAKPAALAKPGGLESKGWQPEAIQWSLPVTADVTTVTTDDGPLQVLAVSSPGKPDKPPADGKSAPEKVAIKRSVDLALEEQTVVALRVRNHGKRAIGLALALKTSDKYLFYESKQRQVVTGDDFIELRFDLKDKTWKCQASSWAPNSEIKDLDQIKELQLLVYNAGSPVDLEITGMQLVKNTEM